MTTPDSTEKQPYVTPRLAEFGDVHVLTREGGAGDVLDADFAAGSQASDLTFS